MVTALRRFITGDAALAQPVEHIIRNDGVACSSHASGTTFPGAGSQRHLTGSRPCDPRAIANPIQDEADRSDIKVIDRALQKLLSPWPRHLSNRDEAPVHRDAAV